MDVGRARGAPGAIFVAACGVTTSVLATAFFFSFDAPWTLGGDNKHELFPMVLEAYRAWTSGRVPEWSDKIWAGFPLLADPDTAALYLPHILPFALTPDPHLRAYDLAVALHLGLLAAGSACLLTLLGASRQAALVGSALAVLSPALHYFMVNCLGIVVAIAWWPWLLVAAERLARATTVRVLRAAVLGWVALGAQGLVYPEFAFYAGVLAVLWILTRRAGLPLHRRLARVLALGAGGVALAAPQLLPSWLYMQDTPRASSPRLAALGSLWLSSPWPLFFRGDARHVWAFFGVGGVVLAAVSVAAGCPRARFLGAALTVAFVLALGAQTPVYGLVHGLPGFDRFRFPYKFQLPAELAFAWLAALGAGRLWRGSRRSVGLGAVVLVLVTLGEHLLFATQLLSIHARLGGDGPGVTAILGAIEDTGLAAKVRAGAPPPRLLDVVGGPLNPFSGHLAAVFGVGVLKGSAVALLSNRHSELLGLRNLGRPDLDRFGVEYVLADRSACPWFTNRIGLDVLTATETTCLLGNPSRPPRFELVAAAELVDSEKSMLAAVRERPRGPVPVVAEAGTGIGTSGGRVEIAWYRPGDVGLRAEAAGEALLLARESWSPGWHARVDGKSVRVYQAGGLFFAVALPSGRHDVELRYRTPGLRAGLVLAGFWLAAALAWGRWRGRRRPGEPVRRESARAAWRPD